MQMNTRPLEDLSNQDLERMYPELYQRLKPYIEDIGNQLRNQKIDEGMLQSIIQDILRQSGTSPTPYIAPPTPNSAPPAPSSPRGTCTSGSCPADIMDDDYYDADVMEVQLPMNFGNNYGRYPGNQNPYYNRRRNRYPVYPVYPIYPMNYNVNPQELVRILLLRQLFGYNYYPYY